METTAHSRGPLGAQFEIPQIPVAGMRGDDDFFTRGQMCLSLLHRPPACPPARAAVAPALQRAIRARCGAGALSPSQFTDCRKPLIPKPSPKSAPLRSSRSRQGCTESGPMGAAPSSNYAPWVGAMCTRWAPQVRPFSPAGALHASSPSPQPLPLPTRRSSLPSPSLGPPVAPTPPATVLSRQTAGE